MGNYLSAFTIYEVLRIIVPGFYSSLILHLLLKFNCNFYSKLINDGLEYYVAFFIFSVLIGAFIYSVDFCRVYKNLLDYLPSNLINKKYGERLKGLNERELENLYYRFYNKLIVSSKAKTEIQSGIYHLFSSFTFITILFLFLLFIITCLSCNNMNNKNFEMNFFLIQINFFVLLFSIISTFLIYKLRLRHSWKRNFEEFKLAVKNAKPEDELYILS